MDCKEYTVSQTTELVGVKSYVLRYWEDELGLRIHRNNLGHRYYTGYDIQLFLDIKELKKRGLKLSAIKELIPKIQKVEPGETASKIKLLGTEQKADFAEDLTQMKEILETPEDLSGIFSEEEAEPEKGQEEEKKRREARMLEFQAILERLIARGLQEKNEEEARCRSLDQMIRKHQMARKEAAASVEGRGRRKKAESVT